MALQSTHRILLFTARSVSTQEMALDKISGGWFFIKKSRRGILGAVSPKIPFLSKYKTIHVIPGRISRNCIIYAVRLLQCVYIRGSKGLLVSGYIKSDFNLFSSFLFVHLYPFLSYFIPLYSHSSLRVSKMGPLCYIMQIMVHIMTAMAYISPFLPDTAAVMLCSATAAFIAKVIFGIPNYEQLFDRIHLYWAATMLRSIERTILSPDEQLNQDQVKWAIEANRLTREKHMLNQRDIFLKELVIEYAIKDKLDKITELDNYGPENWQKKLQDQRLRMWINQNHRYAHFARMPNGLIIREFKPGLHRRVKAFEKDPVRSVSQVELIDGCKTRGGCCARKCQCCMKPRGLDAAGKLVQTHCTVFCGCCVRHRGFISRDSEYGAGIPGFVDHAKETLRIEALDEYYPVS